MDKITLHDLSLEYIVAVVFAVSIVFLFLNQGTITSRFLTSVCYQDGMMAGPSLLPLTCLRITPEFLEVHSGR